jgi:hypothetical protein
MPQRVQDIALQPPKEEIVYFMNQISFIRTIFFSFYWTSWTLFDRNCGWFTSITKDVIPYLANHDRAIILLTRHYLTENDRLSSVLLSFWHGQTWIESSSQIFLQFRQNVFCNKIEKKIKSKFLYLIIPHNQ